MSHYQSGDLEKFFTYNEERYSETKESIQNNVQIDLQHYPKIATREQVFDPIFIQKTYFGATFYGSRSLIVEK